MSGKRVKTINTSSRTITYYTIDSSGVKTPKTVHIKDVLDDSAQTSFLSHPVEKADGTVQDSVLFQPKVKIESANEQQIDPICLLYTSQSPRDRQKSRMPSSA